LVVFAEKFDKVGWEQPDHAPVALQPAHPPSSVAGVEDFNEVAFYEAKVAFCLVQQSDNE
jgi:hypothetical protein